MKTTKPNNSTKHHFDLKEFISICLLRMWSDALLFSDKFKGRGKKSK